MEQQIKIKIITQDDLLNAGCFNVPEVISVVEEAFLNRSNGEVIFPDKVSVVFDESSQNRINCLPAGIPAESVYGMKWVSVFPENPRKFGVQNLSAVILLSDMEKGFPKAFLEGTLCSNLRTAATSAVAAKYLAKEDSKVIGFIGAGEQAKTHFLTMKAVLPSINTCKVSSRTHESELAFINMLSPLYPDVKFISCEGSYEKAAMNSDVIITAISGQSKILQAEWISEGTLYCHVGGLEDEYSVAYKADKIVCDDWEVVKHRTQTISRMYKAGLLRDEDIYCNLMDLVSGKKEGRISEKEFIYFNTVGMSFVDVKVANHMYNKVVEAGLGSDMILQSRPMSDLMYNTSKIITR